MNPRSPSRPLRARRSAYLVMPPGELRRLLARGLGQRELTVQVFDEAYAATDRFARRPADLVLAALAGFGPGDEEFFASLARRSPSTRLVALVGPDEHDAGLRALHRGAHAWLPEPRAKDDVQALLRALDLWHPDGGHDVLAIFAPLAVELAHVFGNRLTALQMVPDEADLPEATRRRLEEAVGEMKQATDRLRRFHEVARGEAVRVPLTRLVTDALDGLVERGVLSGYGLDRRHGGRVLVDRGALTLALEAAADALAGLGEGEGPPRLEVGVGVPRLPYEPLLSGPPLRRPLLQARLRLPGAMLDRERLEACRTHVIWRRDRSRTLHWGLVVPEQLVRRDHGLLLARQGARGASLTFVFPRS